MYEKVCTYEYKSMHRIVPLLAQGVRVRGRAERNELLVSSFVLDLFSSRRGSHLTGLPTPPPIFITVYVRCRPEGQHGKTGKPGTCGQPRYESQSLLHRTARILRDRGGEEG